MTWITRARRFAARPEFQKRTKFVPCIYPAVHTPSRPRKTFLGCCCQKLSAIGVWENQNSVTIFSWFREQAAFCVSPTWICKWVQCILVSYSCEAVSLVHMSGHLNLWCDVVYCTFSWLVLSVFFVETFRQQAHTSTQATWGIRAHQVQASESIIKSEMATLFEGLSLSDISIMQLRCAPRGISAYNCGLRCWVCLLAVKRNVITRPASDTPVSWETFADTVRGPLWTVLLFCCQVFGSQKIDLG